MGPENNPNGNTHICKSRCDNGNGCQAENTECKKGDGESYDCVCKKGYSQIKNSCQLVKTDTEDVDPEIVVPDVETPSEDQNVSEQDEQQSEDDLGTLVVERSVCTFASMFCFLFLYLIKR